MKNKISKNILLGVGMITGLSLLVGNVFASFIVQSAPELGARITVGETQEITYYLPTAENTDTFTEHTLVVPRGANLYSALNSYAPAVGAYTFSTWHTGYGENVFRTDKEDYSTHLVSNTYTVDKDLTVYAKYVQNNVGYYYDGGHHYLTANSSEVAVNASSFFYGTRIYSLNGVEGNEIDLSIDKPGDVGSNAHYNDVNSGVFSFYKNTSDWTVKRVVTISVTNVQTWWFNGDARTHVYVVATSGNYWVDKFLPENSSDKSKNLEVGLDASKIIVTRGKYDTGGWKDDAKGTDTCWNQTIDITFTYDGGRSDSDGDKGTVYGYNHSTIYVSDTESDGKKIYSWW